MRTQVGLVLAGVLGAGAVGCSTPAAGTIDADPLAPDADLARPDADPLAPDARVCPNAHAGVRPRGMWVWQNETIGDATLEAALWAFTDANSIDRIFIQVALTDMPATNADSSDLGLLIAAADAHCVAVELLIGRREWNLTDFRSALVAQATKAVGFTNALTGVRPVALHADIEPQQVDGGDVSGGVAWDWDKNGIANAGTADPSNHRPAILNQLMDNLIAVKAALGTTLPLHLDVGHFMDSTSTSTAIYPFVRTSSTTHDQAHKYLIDIVDSITIMDYRDTAFGPSGTFPGGNGIYNLALNEITYAASVGKHVTIGVNTIPATGEEFTTFLEESRAVMNAQLDLVADAYAGNATLGPAVGGFAVHDYEGYVLLPPTR